MSRERKHENLIVQAVAEAMAARRRELIAQPLSQIWGELAEVAIAEVGRRLLKEGK